MPFLAGIALFVLSYIGLGISFYPYILPPSVTIWDAAAPDSSLKFLLVGALVLIPLILAYTAWAYWVFRGKVGTAGIIDGRQPGADGRPGGLATRASLVRRALARRRRRPRPCWPSRSASSCRLGQGEAADPDALRIAPCCVGSSLRSIQPTTKGGASGFSRRQSGFSSIPMALRRCHAASADPLHGNGRRNTLTVGTTR